VPYVTTLHHGKFNYRRRVDGGAVREAARHPYVEQVTLVEIDPRGRGRQAEDICRDKQRFDRSAGGDLLRGRRQVSPEPGRPL